MRSSLTDGATTKCYTSNIERAKTEVDLDSRRFLVLARLPEEEAETGSRLTAVA